MLPKDIEHWQNLKPPLAPNQEEVRLYEGWAKGCVLLLGETKELAHLCHRALDMYPSSIADQGNWFDINAYYDTIIGDGVINLAGMELIDAVRPHCKRFVTRVFTTKHEGMKYATFFPTEFPNSTREIVTQVGCMFVVYEF